MAYYVHLSVVFPCGDPDSLKRAADYAFRGDLPEEVRQFLAAMRAGACLHTGHKGSICAWGIVGNYTDPAEFVQVLEPFFRQLLLDPDQGFCDFEHVLVFYEREQSERAGAYELFFEKPTERVPDDEWVFVVRHHPALPFAWMQF